MSRNWPGESWLTLLASKKQVQRPHTEKGWGLRVALQGWGVRAALQGWVSTVEPCSPPEHSKESGFHPNCDENLLKRHIQGSERKNLHFHRISLAATWMESESERSQSEVRTLVTGCFRKG